jgi:hypothetical protein
MPRVNPLVPSRAQIDRAIATAPVPSPNCLLVFKTSKGCVNTAAIEPDTAPATKCALAGTGVVAHTDSSPMLASTSH